MKSDAVFKHAYNRALALLPSLGDGAPLPTEVALARELDVSRTTVRKVVAALEGKGAIAGTGRARVVKGRYRRVKPFPQSQTQSAAAQVEKKFMEWILRENVRPGASINELQLARRFGVGTSSVREFLNRFRSFGLLEKRPNVGWLFLGFTTEFALELIEIREMFEVRSALAFAGLPREAPLWASLRDLRREHVELLKDIRTRYHDFSALDGRFHRLVTTAAPNRFINGFFDVIALVFHYHYQWNKRDELQRNETAIREHLSYIDALLSRDAARTERACRAHLKSAKETLMRSLESVG